MQRKKKGHKRNVKHTDKEDARLMCAKLNTVVSGKCGKVYYTSATLAKIGMQDRPHTKLYVYKCPKCQGYHLTRQTHSKKHQRKII